MQHTTFKAYLITCEQLKAAIMKQPIIPRSYTILRPCSVPLTQGGEGVRVRMRRHGVFTITWKYASVDDTQPDPVGISVDGNDYKFTWNVSKVNKWVNVVTGGSQ